MDTSSATASQPRTTAAGPGFLRRVLFAQESGLILVISLMMAALAFFGGDKESPTIVMERASPADAPVVTSIRSAPDALTVTEGAATRTYTFSQGWTASEVSTGVWRLQKFDARVIPAGAAVRELSPEQAGNRSGAIVIDAGGSSTQYPLDHGWRVDTLGDGSQAVLRNPRVNKFLDPTNLVLVGTSAAFFAIMAVGMTAIIAMNGIDLSIGSIYGIAAVIGAIVLRDLHANADGAAVPWLTAVPMGILVCCFIGALCGLINGSMIVGLKVHPFIITLGMMAALRGVVFVITQGQSISGLPKAFTSGFYKAQMGGVYPVPLIVTTLVVVAGVLVLSRTVLGRRVYAIGGNEVAARYAGIPVGRIKIIAFTIAGALAGLSASAALGYYGAATPSGGQGYELQVIAASVIGGASLSGGRGTALGALLGAILIQLIDNGMLILEIDQSYNQIVMGAAIILAVILDQTKQKLGGGKRAH
jgi:ribose transport system permease protein